MKGCLFILVMFLSIAAIGQSRTVSIRNCKFTFKTVFKDNDSGDPIEQLALYRNERKLLTHTVSESVVDCNSESIELGAFDYTDSTITFYSYWATSGYVIAPFGVRKQIYAVDKKGNLRLGQAALYIETSRRGWPENKGIKYLFVAPKNNHERAQLNDYIKAVERAYNGNFVSGAAKVLLFKEVKYRLKRQIQSATKTWKWDTRM